MSRLAVMAHFDHEGDVAPHVRRQVQALAAAVDDLVVVTTAELRPAARAWLARHARLVERANYGYDFFSYKVGLDLAGDLTAYDEVVVCNDSYVPLADYGEVFAAMADRPVDFWGLTASRSVRPHVQSYFVAFRPWLVGSQAFGSFWSEMAPLSDRKKVIFRYEVGLSRRLYDAGFTSDAFFAATPAEEQLASRRVRWCLALRGDRPGPTELREILRRESSRPWNPTYGLADRALLDPATGRARLPLVKIDTLRFDPYGLNAAKLLGLCEQDHPAAFEGVRAHLDATADRYPRRPGETLREPPLALRPLRPVLEYRRAS